MVSDFVEGQDSKEFAKKQQKSQHEIRGFRYHQGSFIIFRGMAECKNVSCNEITQWSLISAH